MATKLSVIVVLYNRLAKDTPIYACLLSSEDQAIFVDNSTDEAIRQANQACLSQAKNMIYVPEAGNQGLPKAYNDGVAQAQNPYLVLFDQDTEVDQAYFDQVKAALVSHPECDVFFPLVINEANQRIFSPSLVKGMHRKSLKEVTQLPAKGWAYLPVNSGVCYTKKLFAEIGPYDERLFIDFVDYSFFHKALAKSASFFFMKDVVLHQHFSGSEKGSLQGAQVRFQHFIEDAKIYYGKDQACLRHYIVTKHRWSLVRRYRSLSFLRIH